MPRALLSHSLALVWAGTALTLTAAHPILHHLENGTLDAILNYVNATALDALNRGNNDSR